MILCSCIFIYSMFNTIATQMDELIEKDKDTSGIIKFGVEGGFKFKLYYGSPLPEGRHDLDDNLETTTDETEFSQRQRGYDDILDTDKIVLNQISGTRRILSGENPKKLTDHIQKLMEILTEFNNTDLKLFLRTVKNEFEKYKSRDSHHFSTFLANRVNEAKNTPSDILRKQMTSIYEKIEEEKFDQHDKKVIESMDSLYGSNYTDKINKFLDDIKNYRLMGAKNVNLNKTVQDVVRSIIFDHYKKINRNDKEAFITKMSKYWTCLAKSSSGIRFQKKIERRLETTTHLMYATQWTKRRLLKRRITYIPHRPKLKTLNPNLKKNIRMTKNKKDQPKRSKIPSRQNKVFIEREMMSIYGRTFKKV